MRQTRYLIQVFLDNDYSDRNLNWSEEDVEQLFEAFKKVLRGNYELAEEYTQGESTQMFILVAQPSCSGCIRDMEIIEIYPKPQVRWIHHVVEIRCIHIPM
jgi:hypothetical protein